MTSGRAPAGDSFTIHVLNNYTDTSFWTLAEHFKLTSTQVGAAIRAEHRRAVEQLDAVGVEYPALRNALVPQPGRHEVAFIIDSTRARIGLHGYSMADTWLPIVKVFGPSKTAIRIGDIIDLPTDLVWAELEQKLVGPTDFPRLHCSEYFVVYLTNLSPHQLRNLHEALTAATTAYIGYVDCSVWTPLKAGLLLPQVGLRAGNIIVTGSDEEGTPNSYGYPFTAAGFDVVGIPGELYGPFLGHRVDNGVSYWADQDSSLSLTAIGGNLNPAATTTITIDENRITYLGADHGASLTKAGLTQRGKDQLEQAIEERLYRGLIYNIRFNDIYTDGIPTPEFNALMYSVQVEFPDNTGTMKRYQVGLKYTPETHVSEVVTFF